MTTFRGSVLLLALVAPLGPGALADSGEIARCAKIASPLDRLECYDSLAAALDLTPAAPGATKRPAAAVEPVTPPPAAPAAAPAAVPDPAPAAGPEPAPAPAAEATPADFGFESERIKETPDEITARYVGEFTGWSGQTLFKLDNGQVWRQTQNGRVSYRKTNPVITIRKGAFGSFRLSVDGLNKTIRVKRVK